MSELEPSRWDRLVTFMNDQGPEMRRLDGLLQEHQVDRMVTIINLEYSVLGRMARQLLQLDRELRRAARILDPVRASGIDSIFVAGMSRDDVDEMFRQKPRRTESSLPAPAPPTYGGLRVTAASAGSVVFVVEAYRYLEDLLTSSPLQAFAVFLNIVQAYGGVRLWMNFRSDPLAKISSRNALRILREFGSHPERIANNTPPDSETYFVGGRSAVHRLPGGTVRLSNGTVATGRRITHIRVNKDGSQDIIHVEG
jgi:hypothetical protein